MIQTDTGVKAEIGVIQPFARWRWGTHLRAGLNLL